MTIDNWRQKIDSIESQIISLINERAKYAQHIGHIKKEQGLAVYDEKREVEIFERIAKKNQGPFPDESVQKVFKTIIEQTRELERVNSKAPSEA
jgi:chorismate mutase